MKVLRRLGVERELVETGIKPNCYISRAWDTGETMYEIVFDAASEARFGGPYLNIHRGDLHARAGAGRHARRRSPSIIGWSISTRRADAIRLVFENGVTADADIVIGADGIRSKVREFLLGNEPPRFVGAVAHRAIFPTERAARIQDSGLHQMVGPRPAYPCLIS